MTRVLLTLCLAAGLPACDEGTTVPSPSAPTADIVVDTVTDAVPLDDSIELDDTTDTAPPEPDVAVEGDVAADVTSPREETEDDVATDDTAPSVPDTTPAEDTAGPMADASEPGPSDAAVGDEDTNEAAGCDPSKMDFTQANAPAYEFYELCIDKGASAEIQGALSAIDPSLYCGVSGAFAGCSGSIHMGCHGDLEFVGATKNITEAKWAQLCALSMQDTVHIIGGGHYVN